MPLYHPRPERWPQVSLKGFFVLLTVLGVGLGWICVQAKWIRDRHEVLNMGGMIMSEDKPPPAPWSIRIFGETGVKYLGVTGSLFPEGDRRIAERWQALFPEAIVETEEMRQRKIMKEWSRMAYPNLDADGNGWID